jgi:prepilin-type N-terminal cleavage/methylation domain-containing protein
MRGDRAVNLIELILAVIILGVVAALTIPRFSSAAPVADEGQLLRERLKTLRVAIERYYQDHGTFPGQQGDGQNAAGTEAAFVSQLTRFTDLYGHVKDAPDAGFPLGPYLRDGLPPCPVPPRAGRSGVYIIRASAGLAFVEHQTAAGWIYNCDTGQIAPNSNASDSLGRSYLSY